MNLDIYVTLSELARLPRGAPHADKVLMCRAEKLCKLRSREFHSESVFNISGRLLESGHKENSEQAYAHVYFYDKWAFAASFIEVGDIIILKGFVVYDVPCIGDKNAEFFFFVTPIENTSVLRVLQDSIQGDVMELTVKEDILEVPRVRVLPKTILAPFMINDV